MEHTSIEPISYPLAPEYRRCCWYVFIGMQMIAAVCVWLMPYVPESSRSETPIVIAVCSLIGIAFLLPLRWSVWTVRIDTLGVARRVLFRWDLWDWDDFSSGRLKKVHRFVFVDPERPLWCRRMNLGYMGMAHAKEAFELINIYYQLPPPPKAPETLKIRCGFRRSAVFDSEGIHLKVRSKSREYCWNDVCRVDIVRTDPLRRDFARLEVALADEEISFVPTSSRQGPAWFSLGGASHEEITEFLLKHVPVDRIHVHITDDLPTDPIYAKRILKDVRQEARDKGYITLFLIACLVPLFILWSREVGAVAALIMVLLMAIVYGSIIGVVAYRLRKRMRELEELLRGSE
ncbi:hypothetical protein ACFL1X_10295 [Candidatus Hydrogenedentota bacterium]